MFLHTKLSLLSKCSSLHSNVSRPNPLLKLDVMLCWLDKVWQKAVTCVVSCLGSGTTSLFLCESVSGFCFYGSMHKGMMCSGYASTLQTTNQGFPCKCLNMVKSLLPPQNSTWAFSLLWSPDQICFLPALCECLSPLLPEGWRKSCTFPEIPPEPFPPRSSDQTCPLRARHGLAQW